MSGDLQILIAPYSAKLPSGNINPKSYPHWDMLVALLSKDGYKVVQIGLSTEEPISGVATFLANLPYAEIEQLVNQCATWISVDSWLPHFVHCKKLKRGITLFGPSDPRVFGYPENINLLRGREHLRQWQFQTWEETDYKPQVFVTPDKVIEAVRKLAPLPYIPPPMLLTADLYQ